MATKRIEVDILSIRSLENLKKELKAYRDSLPERTKQFVTALSEHGYQVALQSLSSTTHQLQNYIQITKPTVSYDETGCYAILQLTPTQILETKWFRTGPDGKGVEVNGRLNPALAAEFGTAAYALPKQERFGGVGGQGTNAKYGNENKTEWYFARGMTQDGKLTDWQHATAIRPTRPLHNALIAMENEIDTLARRYF